MPSYFKVQWVWGELETPLESAWPSCSLVLQPHPPHSLSCIPSTGTQMGPWGEGFSMQPAQCCNSFQGFLKWRQSCTSDSHILGNYAAEVLQWQEGKLPLILWRAEKLFGHLLKVEEAHNIKFKISKQHKSFLKLTHEHIRPCYRTCGTLPCPKMDTSLLAHTPPVMVCWHLSILPMDW